MKNNIVIQKILMDFYKNVMLFFIICYYFLFKNKNIFLIRQNFYKFFNRLMN